MHKCVTPPEIESQQDRPFKVTVEPFYITTYCIEQAKEKALEKLRENPEIKIEDFPF